jgi:beta-lactam-binding protein with PASTA domain
MKNRRPLVIVCIKNALLAVIVVIAVAFIALQWLDFYTRHGRQVAVPNVKGMSVEEAAPFFARKSLQYAVVDSTHVRNKPAGSILETVPPVETHVKEGRTIYLTVNSVIAQKQAVPQVMDLSQRQAEAMLRSLGFEKVRIRVVPGAYKGLVTGLQTSQGVDLAAGSYISADTPLVLLVSSGRVESFLLDGEIDAMENPENYDY